MSGPMNLGFASLGSSSWLEEAVADPSNQSSDILFIRKMRSLAAQGSAGDGRVVATVNGYGTLTGLRIAPEMLGDVPRLEGLVAKAVNRAVDEAERQAPPPPLPPMGLIDVTDLPLPPRPKDPWDPASTSGFDDWLKIVLRSGPGQPGAYTLAVTPILERIHHDAARLPGELQPLLAEVALRLGDPSLNAASARRGAGIGDASILRRFRRHAGVSLTRYIRERQMETAARLAYSSDLPLETVADMLGFTDVDVMRRAIDSWAAPWTLEIMVECWEERKVDCVVWRWTTSGEASTDHAAQVIEDLCRLYPAARAAFEEHMALHDGE